MLPNLIKPDIKPRSFSLNINQYRIRKNQRKIILINLKEKSCSLLIIIENIEAFLKEVVSNHKYQQFFKYKNFLDGKQVRKFFHYASNNFIEHYYLISDLFLILSCQIIKQLILKQLKLKLKQFTKQLQNFCSIIIKMLKIDIHLKEIFNQYINLDFDKLYMNLDKIQKNKSIKIQKVMKKYFDLEPKYNVNQIILLCQNFIKLICIIKTKRFSNIYNNKIMKKGVQQKRYEISLQCSQTKGIMVQFLKYLKNHQKQIPKCRQVCVFIIFIILLNDYSEKFRLFINKVLKISSIIEIYQLIQNQNIILIHAKYQDILNKIYWNSFLRFKTFFIDENWIMKDYRYFLLILNEKQAVNLQIYMQIPLRQFSYSTKTYLKKCKYYIINKYDSYESQLIFTTHQYNHQQLSFQYFKSSNQKLLIMISQSPGFKLTSMTPLNIHHKIEIVEDEPDDLDFEHSKISFNENLIVCTYKPCQSVTMIKKTIQKLKGQPNADWVNPSLRNEERKRATSILRHSQSPTRISSIFV
ncbi:unnamed protein product [Paramecium sonneborni]|uniref:Uncharacterized protein n=1 Tax=Paramecium sonneborni TaxID=65129 RepID=A0A8S1N2L1_9CILI|nr:unnamed protein product [Paramecium sonneborni]